MNKQQIEKVKKGLYVHQHGCGYRTKVCDELECPYRDMEHGNDVCDIAQMCDEALSMIEQMAQEIDDLRAGIPSAEEEPEARTPENMLGMSENARIERVIDKLRLMRRQFQPGSQKSGAILDAMFFLRLMQNRSIEAGDKE